MKTISLIPELIFYCGLFTFTVWTAVRNGAVDGLFFYPKPVQERAFAIGLTDRASMERKRRCFMPLFFAVMASALVMIIRFVNGVTDFRTAYLQSLLFLEVMNWYDGIMIDRLWVGHSDFWILPGTEDLPFVQTWPQVLKKRCILTIIWTAGALISALIVVFLGKIR